ncbi:hypothetical protein [Microbacterium sp. UBA3394]|uniref:hypothetical protein n=1 Tax=Microbacterium sp. UBA3394 TaxID=1946945 RepID=UPI00257FF531|nr:hypothetical protein [Microbacterium sp. UBA3394]
MDEKSTRSDRDEPEGSERKGWGRTIVPPLITAFGAVGAAVIVSLPLSSLAPATPPQLRITSTDWGGAGSAYSVKGEVQNVDDRVLWAFSSRSDGEGGTHPADAACVVPGNGSFTCDGWAGDASEVGEDFTVTVAIITVDSMRTVARMAEQNGSYSVPAEIPAVEGVWAIQSVPLVDN